MLERARACLPSVLVLAALAGCPPPAHTAPDASAATDVPSALDVAADGSDAHSTGSDAGDGHDATATPDAATTTARSCSAGNASALTATGTDAPDPGVTPASVIRVSNVGGAGSYDRVVSMDPGTFGQPCPATACVKQATHVDAALAPFDEELTVVLRGPIELYDFAEYEPSSAAAWTRVSSWNRCGADNVAFLNNLGGMVSGEWTSCGGNSQSYASADGTAAAAAPTDFAGTLGNGVGINLLSARPCAGADDTGACGFTRGVAFHGWSGASGNKVLALRLRMPRFTGTSSGPDSDMPALWLLNARVVRTAQYGCNCRGVGSPGGCGELDVAEVLSDASRRHEAPSEVYSFQGATGSGPHAFLRPVETSATFVVVFDATGRRIQMLRLAPDAFDFGPSVAASAVSAWLAATPDVDATLP